MATQKKPAGSGNRLSGTQLEPGNRQAASTFTGGRVVPQPTDWSFLTAGQQAPSGGGRVSSYGGGTAGYNPAADPTYQAYLNSLDLEAAQRQAQTQQRRAFLEADRDALLGETARSAEQQRENVSGSYEDRGLFQSGAHEQDLARNRQNELSRVGRIQTETGRGISDLEAALAQAMATIQLKKQQASLGIFA